MPENEDIEPRNSDDMDRRRDNLVQRSFEYLKEFEEQGLANVEEPDLEGWGLHRAAIENRVDIARALIARGDDVNAMLKNGFTLGSIAQQAVWPWRFRNSRFIT